MSIEVTVRHMEAPDRLQEYAWDKGRELADGFPRVEHVHVILNQEKRRMSAHVVVQARNHIRLEAEEESENMRASVDEAFEKVCRQLRRLRDKVQDHKVTMKHVAAKRVAGPAAPAEEEETA
jgi:putative sigma-54 modulation protein